MNCTRVFVELGILVLLVIELPGDVASRTATKKCRFQAVFNFGDSNSDTGGRSAALGQVTPPNGETFFGHPAGRYCDGRLVSDFIAEKLKLPHFDAYLDSIATDFRHGSNFATGGSSIRYGGYSPFHLGIQILQFKRFKDRINSLYNQTYGLDHTKPLRTNLPSPADFPKALYTFDIGQNDLSYGFEYSTEEQLRKSLPDIINQYADAIQQLYNEGGRYFWVHNTGPVGCLPYSVIYNGKPGNVDENGCVKSQNDIAQEFNRQLRNKVSELRTQLPQSAFTYVDMYLAKYQLIGSAKKEGFVNPMEFCCGSYYGYHIDCGKTAVVNGTVYGIPCKNPSQHISWDGIHYSEAANKKIADRILNGSLSEPPFAIDEACQLV